MDIITFVNLTSKAWAIPILASLHNGIPGRQAPLIAATGASRTAFAQSLGHLIEMGLLERNPGHGHPLRPEFRLTRQGKEIAAIAHDIQALPENNDQDLLRKSWTLPVLATLYRPRHFNDIKRDLRIVTDRALSQSLKTMENRNWVQRHVNVTARPPRPVYSAVNAGKLISNLTGPQISFISS